MVVAWNNEVEILGGLICKLYLGTYLWYQINKYSGKRVYLKIDIGLMQLFVDTDCDISDVDIDQCYQDFIKIILVSVGWTKMCVSAVLA